jgi:hypothetical protein
MAKWNVPPGPAGGRRLYRGLRARRRGARRRYLSQEAVRSALAELELPTVLGDYRVAPDSGAQIGAKPRLIQIRSGRPNAGTPASALSSVERGEP